jgi:hypothetical protein
MLFHTEWPIPVPMEDDLVHTDHDPFCSDPNCPCHEDPDLIDVVAEQVEDGLFTPDEATRFTQGRQL